MKTIKIYTLSNPDTNEIRYVGKTVSKLEYRLALHISEAKKDVNKSHKNSWIISLLKQGLKPVIELLDEISYNRDWEWLEQYWISQMKSWNFNLINMTDGGDGNKNQKFSKETIEKRKLKIIGIPRSSYVRIKISNSHKGKKLSESTKEKLRIANLGKRYSKETKFKKSKKGVYQYDKDNTLIAVYESLTEAIEKTGFFRGNISSACTGRLKSYKGFIWKYKNKDIVDTL